MTDDDKPVEVLRTNEGAASTSVPPSPTPTNSDDARTSIITKSNKKVRNFWDSQVSYWRAGFTEAVGLARAVLRGLKAFSSYAWMPILTVGVASAIFSYRNLSMQQSGNRPEMIFNRIELHDPYDEGTFSLGMLNVGSRTAYEYQLVIKTVDIDTRQRADLETVSSSNPIRRQGGVSAEPRLKMSNFLGVMALCTTYRDDDDRTFDDQMFVNFPTMTRGLTKDKGGGGQYLAANVSPDDRRKLEKMEVCKR
jgi:hypothetical protein